MGSSVKLAVAGAGLVGKRHIDIIAQSPDLELIAIVDPDASSKELAATHQVPWHPNLTELFSDQSIDGVVIATPNNTHVECGLTCVANRCSVLVEKPIATTSDAAKQLVDAAHDANVPLLVGHHRRHSPLIQRAKEWIDDGRLGELRAVHAICWLYKPDEYFHVAPWRTRKGAGPVAVNLIHDIDLLRYLCGEIINVQAQASPSSRGFENEDVAVAVLKFSNGALGTVSVSDSIAAPWSWEMTAHENPVYPETTQSCYLLGGSAGSLSLPDLTVWQHQGQPSWTTPINYTSLTYETGDPIQLQLKHFADVIKGRDTPLVSGEAGRASLSVI